MQRALLNVLQSEAVIKATIEVPSSFGGIGGRSVRDAIEMAYSALKTGAKYYIRSDIEGFFTKIPRITVIEKINSLLPDSTLSKILDDASKAEFDDLSSLGGMAELFPDMYTGVPQGCCLSPLFGNILLNDFDKSLNTKDITCIRYIDDFIILGPTLRDVNRVFKKAQSILGLHGLIAYDPDNCSGKAQKGQVGGKGFDFLGCTISTSFIHPNGKAREKIKNEVKDVLRKNAAALDCIKSGSWMKDYSFINTLQKVNNMLMGWGHQYSFCNATALFRDIDSEIDGFLRGYLHKYSTVRDKFKSDSSHHDILRKLLGVHLLHESKYEPIVGKKITGSP